MDRAQKQTIKKRAMDYDGIFKEYLQRLSDKAIIAFINSVFKKSYPPDSEVTRLNKEDNLENGKRLADTYIRINDDVFHIELQTKTDKSIALRMFEYGFAAAVQHGKEDLGNNLRLRFPEPTVIYLRSTKNVPDEITVELELPKNNIVNFEIPVKKMKDFDISALVEKEMYPIIPFNAMKYESKFNEEAFLSDLDYISKALIQHVEQGKLLAQEAKDIIKKSFDIAQNVVSELKIQNYEEVIEKMESIDRVEVTDILGMCAEYEKKGEIRGIRKGRAEGKAEGKAEGTVEGKAVVVINMTAKNKNIVDIMEVTELTRERVLSIQERNADLISKRKTQFESRSNRTSAIEKKNPPLVK